MKEIYKNYIDNAFGDFSQAVFKFKQFDYNYRPFFPLNKDAELLDIGIGRGEMMSCMKEWGYLNYRGIDISSSTVKFCKSLNLNCELVDDTASWLKANRNRFDLVTLLDVLEHVKKENTLSFLSAIRLSLKDKGILIIQVPNLQAPDGQLHRYNDFTHEVGYVEHSLRQVLVTAGLKEVEFFGFEDSVTNVLRERIRRILRSLYWLYVYWCRKINGNLSPRILNPVLFAVAKK